MPKHEIKEREGLSGAQSQALMLIPDPEAHPRAELPKMTKNYLKVLVSRGHGSTRKRKQRQLEREKCKINFKRKRISLRF
jgi:hypothetical protein